MYARLGIVLYLFSTTMLIAGLWIQDATGIPVFPDSSRAKQELESRIGRQQMDPNSVNVGVTYIFGDYTSAARMLFSIITGESVFFVLRMIPMLNSIYLMYFLTAVYSFGTVMLIVYIIGNRAL